jgi:Mg/Co/Ni transporter MgtE
LKKENILTQNNLQEVQSRIEQLSLADKAKLINGISMEAAHILKKILPDSPAIDALITTKSNFGKL